MDAGCLDSRLYSYSSTGTNDYTLIDMSAISEDYVDNDLTRIEVTTSQDNWKYGNQKLLIKTDAGNEDFTIMINDFLYSDVKVSNTTAPAETKTLDLNDFSKVNNQYTIIPLQEESAAPWDPAVNPTYKTDLDILCDSYSPDTLDLTDYNDTVYTIGVKQLPQFRIKMDDNIIREQKITAADANIPFYLAADTSDLIIVDFALQDYTGDYPTSILHIQRPYSDIYQDVDSRQWDGGGKISIVFLKPNVYYKIVLTTPTSTQDKGLFVYTKNGTQDIVLTKPLLTFAGSQYDGLIFTTWHNVTTQRVYCYYKVAAGLSFTSANFTVYNATTIPPAEIYTTTNTTTNEATLSYLVPNSNETYKTICQVVYENGNPSYTNIYSFTNITRFMGPTTFSGPVMGYTLDDIFKGVSVFGIVFVLGFASMVNASIITLLGVGILWLFNYWNWVSINPIILSFLLVFAVVYRFKQSREDKG